MGDSWSETVERLRTRNEVFGTITGHYWYQFGNVLERMADRLDILALATAEQMALKEQSGELNRYLAKTYDHVPPPAEQMDKRQSKGVYVCGLCGCIRPNQEEVMCWKCGKGAMIYRAFDRNTSSEQMAERGGQRTEGGIAEFLRKGFEPPKNGYNFHFFNHRDDRWYEVKTLDGEPPRFELVQLHEIRGGKEAEIIIRSTDDPLVVYGGNLDAVDNPEHYRSPLPEGAKEPITATEIGLDAQIEEHNRRFTCRAHQVKYCRICFVEKSPAPPDEPCERECDHDWRVLGLVRSVVCNDCGQPGSLPVGTADESCKHEFMAYGSAYKVSDTCRKCGTRKEGE